MDLNDNSKINLHHGSCIRCLPHGSGGWIFGHLAKREGPGCSGAIHMHVEHVENIGEKM